ncbi:MAG: hypothetical protein HQL44_16990, partial [Alphaproteobacteria bacterium]|nr:hypothetical protein [Alphaproteobacteria bacterium]
MANHFRVQNDASVDPKWGVVAKRIGQPRHLVIALFLRLLEIASANRPRGFLGVVKPDEIADVIGCEESVVTAAIAVMREVDPATGRPRFIRDDGAVVNWPKYQPTRERDAGPDLLDHLTNEAGANPAAGASPAKTRMGANPVRRANRQDKPQDVVVCDRENIQTATNNHCQAISSQSPPPPPF